MKRNCDRPECDNFLNALKEFEKETGYQEPSIGDNLETTFWWAFSKWLLAKQEIENSGPSFNK